MSRRGENIYKRRDGRWEGRCRDGWRANGKPKYRSIYGHSYREVKVRLAKVRSKLPMEPISSGSVTVKELFAEWLDAVQLCVKPSTFANYIMKVQKHILPAFGGIPYAKITAEYVRSFIQQKLASGLSAKYVADIVIVFKSMAKYMNRLHGYQNPLAHVLLPKQERTERRLLTKPEQLRLVRCLKQNLDPTALCILLSLYTGLRVGEVCGLKWDDIDFIKSTLTVRRTVQRIYDGSKTVLHIGAPKSRSSCRTIPIPAFLKELLLPFQKAGNCFVFSGCVIPKEPRTLQRRFQLILKKAELPSVNYHSLRHLFATNCIQLGFDIKTLAELLGHHSAETTLNRYLHSSMERKASCMRLLDSAG